VVRKATTKVGAVPGLGPVGYGDATGEQKLDAGSEGNGQSVRRFIAKAMAHVYATALHTSASPTWR